MNRPVARRPRVERQALHRLRGSGARVKENSCFADLRTQAFRHGLQVLDPDTAYLADSELTLLAWIAVAQRRAYAAYLPTDRALAEAVERGALALMEMGLLLSPFSMYTPWLRGLSISSGPGNLDR